MANIFAYLLNKHPEDSLLKTLSSFENISYLSSDTRVKIANFLWDQHEIAVRPLEDVNALALLIENYPEIITFDSVVIPSNIIIAACACKNIQFLKKLPKKYFVKLILTCGYIINGIEFINELVEENCMAISDMHHLMKYACNNMDIELIENLINFGEDIVFTGINRLITHSDNMDLFAKLCHNCDLNEPSRYNTLVNDAWNSETHFKYLVSIGVDLLRTETLNKACGRDYEPVIDYLLCNGVQPNDDTLKIIIEKLRRSSPIILIFKKYSIDFSHINQVTNKNEKISFLTNSGIDHEFALEQLLK